MSPSFTLRGHIAWSKPMSANAHTDVSRIVEQAANHSDPIVSALAGVVEDLVDEVQRLREAQDYQARDHASTKARVHELEEADEEQEGSTDSPTPTTYLPIEDLANAEPSERFKALHPREERAVTMWEHLPKWGRYNGAYDKLTLSIGRDNLKTLLGTATGEDLAWKQVKRACMAVERLSKGTAELTKHKRHGWMLVVHQPGTVWPEKYGRKSSVGTE